MKGLVYDVRPEKIKEKGKIQTLHKNMWMPCHALLDNKELLVDFTESLRKYQDVPK